MIENFQEEVEYKVEAVDDGLVISIQVIRTIMTLFLPESTFCILSHCLLRRKNKRSSTQTLTTRKVQVRRSSLMLKNRWAMRRT